MADNNNGGQGQSNQQGGGSVLPPAQVNYSEMNEADTAMVIEIATNALRTQDKSERPVYHRDIAQLVKQQMDTAKGGTWHVIVGISFGSFVSHETKTMIHLSIGNVSFQIWRHG